LGCQHRTSQTHVTARPSIFGLCPGSLYDVQSNSRRWRLSNSIERECPSHESPAGESPVQPRCTFEEAMKQSEESRFKYLPTSSPCHPLTLPEAPWEPVSDPRVPPTIHGRTNLGCLPLSRREFTCFVCRYNGARETLSSTFRPRASHGEHAPLRKYSGPRCAIVST
jgi:hypothetical protein